jgi:2-succinyl-5-enolpyruvyl-6-hydroxy-3-cyclohexene-1-carboxylate synthase
MTNFDLSYCVFDFFKKCQVETIVICAGARNAPLVMALQKEDFKIVHFFEERSAAFFSLGLMKSSNKPVAIVTTSGTAVAEVLPAAIEATYQGLPLIIVSADRPKSYRQSGAPQAIEQVGLFSHYVSETYDLDVYSEDFNLNWNPQKPIHLNLCFDEPLIDLRSENQVHKVTVTETPFARKMHSTPEIQNPMLIVGELKKHQVKPVIDFILKHQVPVYAESLSQLRHREELKPYLIFSSDILVKRVFQEKIVESVIRVGGVPTLRFWRDLESSAFSQIQVYHFSDLSYSGLARNSTLFQFDQLRNLKVVSSVEPLQKIKSRDHDSQIKKHSLIQRYPKGEPALVFELSKFSSENPIYLGNSLPIRHWDQFTCERSTAVYANRGANGLDGQVSTYLGWSEQFANSFCFIGDLTALYDLASLGLTNQLQKNKRSIVVMNNFGGQIFKRIFKNDLFLNSHQTQFQNWAALWGWAYSKKLIESDDLNTIIELQPDTEQTKLFWDEWDQQCQMI